MNAQTKKPGTFNPWEWSLGFLMALSLMLFLQHPTWTLEDYDAATLPADQWHVVNDHLVIHPMITETNRPLLGAMIVIGIISLVYFFEATTSRWMIVRRQMPAPAPESNAHE